jgi:pyridoxamine 5'-phosphate oxidase
MADAGAGSSAGGPLIAAVRKEYTRAGLREEDLAPDPFAQFETWFAEAQAAGIEEPTAFTLATATPDGMPSARTVLLKGCDRRGLVFYTNYESAKAADLADNPRAAVLFFWKELQRQVRMAGTVERTSPEESEAYFRSRPLGSRLGATVSPQSQPIPDRAWIEQRFAELEARYAAPDAVVPLPDFWGGYRVIPATWEFWQGRENRLHDRLRYVPDGTGGWRIERLAP